MFISCISLFFTTEIDSMPVTEKAGTTFHVDELEAGGDGCPKKLKKIIYQGNNRILSQKGPPLIWVFLRERGSFYSHKCSRWMEGERYQYMGPTEEKRRHPTPEIHTKRIVYAPPQWHTTSCKSLCGGIPAYVPP
jgi:hypothetical protein